MNDLETSLRDAFVTRAGAVPYDPAAYGAIVRRRERRRVTRLTQPAIALAATVALVGASVLVTRSSERHTVAVSGGPRRLIALRSFGSYADGSHRTDAVVLDSAGLTGPPVLHITNDTYDLRAVTAAGDGRTFYGTGVPRGLSGCRLALLRIDPEVGTTPIGWVSGWQPSVAVSRDGRQLAYASRLADPESCSETNTVAVSVRDLATGAERTWTGPTEGTRTPSELTWSPDGRTLAYEWGLTVGTLDTRQPGTAISPPRDRLDFSHSPKGALCSAETPAYLPTGELVVGWRCVGGGVSLQDVRVFDARRQLAGRLLFRLPTSAGPTWLALDPTGRYALAGLRPKHHSGAEDRIEVVYWNGKGRPKPVDTGDASMEFIAW
jgi:hypothetical protein